MKKTSRFGVLLLVSLLCSSVCNSLVSADRPNVLLLLVDDLKPAIGAFGDSFAKTPNLDSLAGRGMRFDLAYCNQAVCAPSRFTLMLGSHSTSSGLYGLGSQLRQSVPDAITLPQHFAKHGYRTESLGKVFHIGHGNHGDPESFSVPHFHDKVIEYLDPASTDGGKLTREEAYFTNQKLDSIRSLPRGAAFESPDVADEEYADGRVALETMKRLRAAKELREKDGTPFFITAGFARPHLPFSAPKKYWDLHDRSKLPLPKFEKLPNGSPAVAGKRGGEINNYKPVPLDNSQIDEDLKRNLIHGYYASTSFVDTQIGKVLGELDRLQLGDNTIVVLWGDHGFHLGDLGIWTKHTNYEQANRIPIVIAAPGVTKPGSATRQPAESVDLFPTLAELAGLPAPQGPQPIDGVSLVPVLREPDKRVRDHAYHAYPRKKLGRAIRTERYRLVEWRGNADPESVAEYELYDYQTDPLETQNRVADKPAVVAELKKILAQYPPPVGRSKKKTANATPSIAKRELVIVAEVQADSPHGVVVAQGGNRYGYALHFKQGKPVFDVRIMGKVTRVAPTESCQGDIKLRATLTATEMTLTIGDRESVKIESPGLISVQPMDGLDIGFDGLTAAGDYSAPNRFNGKVVRVKVTPTAD
jgi:iduronate 2-sulfatase